MEYKSGRPGKRECADKKRYGKKSWRDERERERKKEMKRRKRK
jgi:hypothetical protein